MSHAETSTLFDRYMARWEENPDFAQPVERARCWGLASSQWRSYFSTLEESVVRHREWVWPLSAGYVAAIAALGILTSPPGIDGGLIMLAAWPLFMLAYFVFMLPILRSVKSTARVISLICRSPVSIFCLSMVLASLGVAAAVMYTTDADMNLVGMLCLVAASLFSIASGVVLLRAYKAVDYFEYYTLQCSEVARCMRYAHRLAIEPAGHTRTDSERLADEQTRGRMKVVADLVFGCQNSARLFEMLTPDAERLRQLFDDYRLPSLFVPIIESLPEGVCQCVELFDDVPYPLVKMFMKSSDLLAMPLSQDDGDELSYPLREYIWDCAQRSGIDKNLARDYRFPWRYWTREDPYLIQLAEVEGDWTEFTTRIERFLTIYEEGNFSAILTPRERLARTRRLRTELYHQLSKTDEQLMGLPLQQDSPRASDRINPLPEQGANNRRQRLQGYIGRLTALVPVLSTSCEEELQQEAQKWSQWQHRCEDLAAGRTTAYSVTSSSRGANSEIELTPMGGEAQASSSGYTPVGSVITNSTSGCRSFWCGSPPQRMEFVDRTGSVLRYVQ